MEAVWSRKYEMIITADMRYPVVAGCGVPAPQMMQSASACILDGELIILCLVRKDLAKCRDSASPESAQIAPYTHGRARPWPKSGPQGTSGTN